MAPQLHESEKVVERFLVERVQLLGGMTMKIMPTVAGAPDRLVLLPGARMYFVELKASDGRLSAVQEHFHETMGYLDIPVAVLYNRSQVVDWVRSVTEQAYRDDQPATSEDPASVG